MPSWPLGRGRLAVAAVVVLVGGEPVAAQAACAFRGTPDALLERPSPLDSVTVTLGGAEAKLCYGRPSARGRTVIGNVEPYGVPWRFGANEPTTLHLPVPARIGDVDLEAGSYSLYAVPERDRWRIVVNGRTNRWGIPISVEVRAADLGSFTVPVVSLPEHVETLELSFEPTSSAGGDIVYRWERTALHIPIQRR